MVGTVKFEARIKELVVLLRPGILEAPVGRGRKPAGVLAQQRDKCLLELSGGDALGRG
jgi:hypothetical protein